MCLARLCVEALLFALVYYYDIGCVCSLPSPFFTSLAFRDVGWMFSIKTGSCGN